MLEGIHGLRWTRFHIWKLFMAVRCMNLTSLHLLCIHVRVGTRLEGLSVYGAP